MRHELLVRSDAVVLREPDRVAVPSALMPDYLTAARRAHDGIVRTKQLLRSLAWRPGIDRDVAAVIRSCDSCKASEKVLIQVPRKTSMQSVPFPTKPWGKIGLDIVEPIRRAPHNARFTVTMSDYYSKWVEDGLTSTVTADSVISIVSAVWAREGYPDELVTDNGTQLTSQQFESYLQRRAIKHRRSSVY